MSVTYDVCARVTLASDVKRPSGQAREYFDQISEEAHLGSHKRVEKYEPSGGPLQSLAQLGPRRVLRTY